MAKSLAICVALLLVGFLLGAWLPGLLAKAPTTSADRITSECAALVDLAHRDKDGDKVASWQKIEAELIKQGVKLPPAPKWEVATTDAYGKALDERREQIRSLPEYSAAWSAAHQTIVKEGIYECVTVRLAKEGVRR
jgi:hypothetical protein